LTRQGRWKRSRDAGDCGLVEKLGMSEYAERFAENRIDLSVLPDLTDQHLKDLGIALGDRLKMLRAIRELSGAVLAAPQHCVWRLTGRRKH
jgi:SAM domain (Sterile alpha motif)